MPFCEIGGVTAYHGDCLDVMPMLPDGCADMILCDLPYGATVCRWDTVIPFEPLWEQYRRLIKPNGTIVLTATQPFTSALVMSNPKWFRYDWAWIKNRSTNFVHAQRQPLRKHEQVLVFYGAQPTYNAQGLRRYGKVEKPRYGEAHPTGERIFRQKNQTPYLREYTGYPTTELRFDIEPERFHPTQKPVALFEYLIRTYTNPGEMVLDNCAGSGTTGIAALNTGRRAVLIEKEAEYCEVIRTRLQDRQPSLFETAAALRDRVRGTLSEGDG